MSTHLTRRKLLAVASLLLSITGLSAAQEAGGRTLRATFLGLNPVQGRVDPATGESTGIVPDLARELGRRLGVAVEIHPAASASEIIQRLRDGRSDIGFMAIDPRRAQEVTFSAPYAVMGNAFLAPAGWRIRRAADIDQPGVQIAAIRGQTQATALSASVRQARVVVLDRKPDDLAAFFETGAAHVYGTNRHEAEQIAVASAGRLEVLEGDFLQVQQAIAVAPEAAGRLPEINRLISELLSIGEVDRAIARSGIRGLKPTAFNL